MVRLQAGYSITSPPAAEHDTTVMVLSITLVRDTEWRRPATKMPARPAGGSGSTDESPRRADTSPTERGPAFRWRDAAERIVRSGKRGRSLAGRREATRRRCW